MGEYERGLGDVADLAGAGGEVAWGSPTAGPQCGQVELGVGPVQGAEHVGAGGGDVVSGPGFDLGQPQREAVGFGQGLDVAAGFAGACRSACAAERSIRLVDESTT